MRQGWYAPIIEAQGDGTALANSTAQTSILPLAAKFPFSGGQFSKVGDRLAVFAAGRVSNIVTTPGTLTFDLKLGNVVVATSGAITLNTTAKTNVAWILEWYLTLRAVGQAANFMHQGFWQSESVVSSPAGTMGCFGMPASAPAVGSNFDATAAQVLDLMATWSIANSGNSIQLHQYTVDSPN